MSRGFRRGRLRSALPTSANRRCAPASWWRPSCATARGRKGSERLSQRIEAVLSALEVLAFEEPADRRYAELRTRLERRGTPIGPNDLLIAAQALAADLTVVTANVDEFRRVPALLVENWLVGADASV